MQMSPSAAVARTTTEPPAAATTYRLHRRPGALPLLGDLLRARADHLGFLDECMGTGADIVEVDLATRAGFAVFHPDAVRQVLVDDNDLWLREGNLETRAIAAYFGRGVLTTDGPDWLACKRLNAPAFAREAVTGMQALIDDSIDRSLAAWPATTTERPLFDDFLALAVTATTTAFFSERPDADEQADLLEAMREGPELIFDMARNRAPWLRHLPTPRARRVNRAVAAVEKLIARNVARRAREGSRDRADLLDLIVSHRDPRTGALASPDEIRDHLFTALIAAPENIATTLAWASHALATNPTILDELRRTLAHNDRTYLRAVIDETMRRHAPTPMIDRTAARDTNLGGIQIPRKSLLLIPILAIHNNPRYWESPATFRPARFLDNPKPAAWFPFGHGPRKCIGERLGRAVIESALSRFVIGFDWNRPTKEEPGVSALVNLRPRDRMRMLVSRVA